MKITGLIFAVLLLMGCSPINPSDKNQGLAIIFDTDCGPDYDDVGALAFLHAMADSGKVDILATISCNGHELVGPVINSINTYFNRPDLLMAAPKGNCVNITAFQHWPDSITAKYPHTLKSTNDLQDAVYLYRKILASRPDTSVTIVTVGFLTNLAALLKSGPDSLSTLSGQDLVKRKVKKLVSMAGSFPEGREYNVYMDSVASAYVFENWPTSITFSGWEIGSQIKTGLRLISEGEKNSPIRDVFRISIPMATEDSAGRSSWDQTAVLIAVYGEGAFFSTRKGKIIVHSDGSNKWENNPDGRHSFVVFKQQAPDIARFIEDRMMHRPETRP